MIKVIKPGSVYIHTCSKCGAIFLYQDADVPGGYVFECPECHDKIRAKFELWNGTVCPDCKEPTFPFGRYCHNCGRQIPRLEDYKL